MKIFTLANCIGAAALALTAVSSSAAVTRGFLMTAPTVAELPDDDERAAAEWFVQQPDTRLVQASDLASLDVKDVPVLWVMIDRNGATRESVEALLPVDAIKAYSAKGGCLYISNMATQILEKAGFVPAGMNPGIFGNGEGGDGTDHWTINPILGFDFRPGSSLEGEQGYYDNSNHPFYAGCVFDDPNGYGYQSIPMIGPGRREDHNSMWDCNPYGKGSEKDVIANFEKTTGSKVVATWGHVKDHCVAGLVDFPKTDARGPVVVNGFAAYEWNQNSGANPHQGNIEKLTSNIFDELAKSAVTDGIDGVDAAEEGAAEYYTLQGVKANEPANGLFIKVQGGKAVKVLVK